MVKKKGLNGNLMSAGRALEMTGASDEETTNERGPAGAWAGCHVRAKAAGWGQGQRWLPYFFMRTTLTEERQNEWPVKTNEKE